jgi:hypothetical protein
MGIKSMWIKYCLTRNTYVSNYLTLQYAKTFTHLLYFSKNVLGCIAFSMLDSPSRTHCVSGCFSEDRG